MQKKKCRSTGDQLKDQQKNKGLSPLIFCHYIPFKIDSSYRVLPQPVARKPIYPPTDAGYKSP